MSQAPPDRGSGGADGRLPVYENQRQKFQSYWWDFMQGLPTQVRRPLRDALKPNLSLARRRAARHHARRELAAFVASARAYADSVDDMLNRRGIEYVDPTDPVQAAAFVNAITPAGIKALDKRHRVAAAIAYARMTLEWLDRELGHGD